MQQLQAVLIIVGMFLVRLGIPVAVAVVVSYWLRRVDARWAAEASAYERAKAWQGLLLPLSPAAQKPAITPPCWERRGCSSFQRAQCAAGQQPCLPCWLARLQQEGKLPKACVGCAIFALPVPPPVTVTADD